MSSSELYSYLILRTKAVFMCGPFFRIWLRGILKAEFDDFQEIVAATVMKIIKTHSRKFVEIDLKRREIKKKILGNLN